MIKLMYITNNPRIAALADEAGVDRIFDMGRTVLNITGDAACAVIVSKLERKKASK